VFQAKTVFVVGAGASCEVHLPTGEQLKGLIARLLDIRFEDGYRMTSGDPRLMEALRRHVAQPDGRPGNPNALLHKCWQIRDNLDAAISIDNFLDAHAGDADLEFVGKLGIVKAILDSEKASKLRPKERGDGRFSMGELKDTWYRSFFRMVSEGVRRSDVNNIFQNVSFITFNYDRTIERVLAQQLHEYYALSEQEAQELVGNLEIHHPYGTIGPLLWQDRHGVGYGDNERANLIACAQRIKTFTQGVDDQADIERIRSLVRDADVLGFIGFAFHPMNMQILNPGGDANVQRVFASVMGLSRSDQAETEGDINELLQGERFFLPGNGPTIETFEGTCANFFEHFRRSLPAPNRD